MTAPRQQTQSLLDLEHEDRSDRRDRGPVTFSDDESLQRRLDRRGTDRRGRERRRTAAPPSAAELGTRELCHDLRQPLASAVLLTHMLDKEQGLTAAARQQLGLLHAELGRLAGMLTSQLEAAALVPVDVAAVVRGVCDVPPDAASAPVELCVEEAPLVLGDPVQLARMVANLVMNARGAAGAAGAVRVHVGGASGAVSIDVEDSGGAVGSAATSGFGLGLMIVDSVVRRHGGGSTCTPSRLGGLKVSVTIPAATPSHGVGGGA